MRGERGENSLLGRSGPAQSDRPGGSGGGPCRTHSCGARVSPAGRRPGQPLLPCPRLPGKHPPRKLRPSQHCLHPAAKHPYGTSVNALWKPDPNSPSPPGRALLWSFKLSLTGLTEGVRILTINVSVFSPQNSPKSSGGKHSGLCV